MISISILQVFFFQAMYVARCAVNAFLLLFLFLTLQRITLWHFAAHKDFQKFFHSKESKKHFVRSAQYNAGVPMSLLCSFLFCLSVLSVFGASEWPSQRFPPAN